MVVVVGVALVVRGDLGVVKRRKREGRKRDWDKNEQESYLLRKRQRKKTEKQREIGGNQGYDFASFVEKRNPEGAFSQYWEREVEKNARHKTRHPLPQPPLHPLPLSPPFLPPQRT